MSMRRKNSMNLTGNEEKKNMWPILYHIKDLVNPNAFGGYSDVDEIFRQRNKLLDHLQQQCHDRAPPDYSSDKQKARLSEFKPKEIGNAVLWIKQGLAQPGGISKVNDYTQQLMTVWEDELRDKAVKQAQCMTTTARVEPERGNTLRSCFPDMFPDNYPVFLPEVHKQYDAVHYFAERDDCFEGSCLYRSCCRLPKCACAGPSKTAPMVEASRGPEAQRAVEEFRRGLMVTNNLPHPIKRQTGNHCTCAGFFPDSADKERDELVKEHENSAVYHKKRLWLRTLEKEMKPRIRLGTYQLLSRDPEAGWNTMLALSIGYAIVTHLQTLQFHISTMNNYDKNVRFVVSEGNPINGMQHVELLALLFILKEGIVIGGFALIFFQACMRKLAFFLPRLQCGDERETWMSRLNKYYHTKLETASMIIDYTFSTVYLIYVMAKNMSTLYRLGKYLSMILSGQVNNSTSAMYDKMSNIANIAWNATLFILMSRLRDYEAAGKTSAGDDKYDSATVLLADTPFDFWGVSDANFTVQMANFLSIGNNVLSLLFSIATENDKLDKVRDIFEDINENCLNKFEFALGIVRVFEDLSDNDAQYNFVQHFRTRTPLYPDGYREEPDAKPEIRPPLGWTAKEWKAFDFQQQSDPYPYTDIGHQQKNSNGTNMRVTGQVRPRPGTFLAQLPPNAAEGQIMLAQVPVGYDSAGEVIRFAIPQLRPGQTIVEVPLPSKRNLPASSRRASMMNAAVSAELVHETPTALAATAELERPRPGQPMSAQVPAGYASAGKAIQPAIPQPASLAHCGAFLEVIEGGFCFVKEVIPGSAAWRSGLQVGMHVVRINGTDTSDLSLEDIASKMEGSAGNSVEIGVASDDDSGTLIFLDCKLEMTAANPSPQHTNTMHDEPGAPIIARGSNGSSEPVIAKRFASGLV